MITMTPPVKGFKPVAVIRDAGPAALSYFNVFFWNKKLKAMSFRLKGGDSDGGDSRGGVIEGFLTVANFPTIRNEDVLRLTVGALGVGNSDGGKTALLMTNDGGGSFIELARAGGGRFSGAAESNLLAPVSWANPILDNFWKDYAALAYDVHAVEPYSFANVEETAGHAIITLYE